MIQRIFLFLALVITLLSAQKMNIAVNQLSGQNIDASTLTILSERTRTEFIQTGAFTVIERTEMDAILHEMGIQQSGVCDESSCLVEVGKVLGVEQIVAGSVGKLNDTFFAVSLRIIDVESSAILHAINYDHRGNMESLLSSGIKNAVVQLVENADITIRDAQYSGKFGELYISSSEDGATITVDGVEYEDNTPHLFDKFPAGKHQIVVTKGTYVGRTELTLEPTDFQRIMIPMEQSQVDLFVKSNPLGATIVIDGENRGTTPFKIDDIQAGEHQLELSLDGYALYSETINLGISELERHEVELTALGYLTINTTPSGADIMLNGESVGTSPVENYATPEGEYTVQIYKSNYDPIEEDIFLYAEDTILFSEELRGSFGTVNIITHDDAKVHVDGLNPRVGRWFSQKVVPGPHEFTITCDDYYTHSEQFIVARGETFGTTIELKETEESITASKRKRQVIRRIAFGTLSAASLGLGIMANGSNDDGNSVDSKRNILFATSGLFAVGFGLSIPF